MANFKLNEQIASLRKEKGITQEELAQALGVTNQAVSKWESAQCCPDIQLLPDIADYFGVSIDELMGYKPKHTAGNGFTDGPDPLLERAVAISRDAGQSSPSLLQRKLNIGYARALRLIGQMTELGYTDAMGSSFFQWKEK